MNTFKILFFLILIGLNVSCSNDEESIDEQMAATCTEEVSFTEDGVAVTLPVLSLSAEPAAIFDLKDPSPFNPGSVSRALGLRLQSGLSAFDIVLELNVENATACIPVGVYDTNTLDVSEGLLSFAYLKGFDSYLVGLGVGQGILEITKCDFENGLISGKFSCTLGQGLGPDMINITEGVFENVCLAK